MQYMIFNFYIFHLYIYLYSLFTFYLYFTFYANIIENFYYSVHIINFIHINLFHLFFSS